MAIAASDARCQVGAVISCRGNLYTAWQFEDLIYENYGRLGGWLGHGLFVIRDGSSAISWLSNQNVADSMLVNRAPRIL